LAKQEKSKQEKDPSSPVAPIQKINQTTTKAILKRQIVREIFEKAGLSVTRDNVEIMDQSMENFQISGAYLDRKYEISFAYDQAAETVTNVKLKKGRLNLDYSEESFARETFIEDLYEKLR
jgi:hypothetical protein